MSNQLDVSFFTDEHGNHYAKYKSLLLSSVFQPIFNRDNKVVGVEALLRMKDDRGERICPGYFFSDENPAHEEKGYIDLISRIVHIQNFVASQKKDIKLFLNFLPNNFKNFSQSCLHDIHFLETLENLKMCSQQIVLELLEVHCDNIEQLQVAAKNMFDQGFNIAIDDFGAQHSNTERVEKINPNVVKIDRLVLEDYMHGKPEKLLEAMEIAKKYSAQTVIEGIETQEHLDTIRALDIDMYQGYFLAMPAPLIPYSNAFQN
ncbi:MAG: EAL domain-containing protein [Vibrio sp.]